MWIFTKWGFFSVTQTTRRADQIQIRARARVHLENLQKAFPILERSPISETPENDYRFRIIVMRWRWEALGQKLTAAIDYSNFKGEVQRAGFARDMLDELHRIWTIMFGFQSRKHPFDPMAGEPKLFREAGDPLIDMEPIGEPQEGDWHIPEVTAEERQRVLDGKPPKPKRK